MNRSQPLLVVLLGTFLLGLLFLFTVPPGYGPDEPSHFGYVRTLANGSGFPVLGRNADPQGATYEAHQPPLYYVYSVPAYVIGRGMAGERGAWIAVRLFSLLCGLATVALVYFLVLRLFPEETDVAAAAAAFTGWLPSQVAMFAVVNNDPLTELGFTLTLYLLARYLLDEERRPRMGLWLGLAAGATVLAKSSALVLLPVVLLILLVVRRPSPESGRGSSLLPFGGFILGALVCVPWLLRNQHLYGDLLGWKAFVAYFLDVHHSPTPHTLAEKMGMAYSPAWYWVDMVWNWVYRDSLGMWLFSRPNRPLPMRVALPPALYTLWALLWLGAIFGGVRFAIVEGKMRSREWQVFVGALLLTLFLLVIAYLRLNAVFFWAQSRYVFPAVAALALIWSVGLSRLSPAPYRRYLLWGVNGLLFLVTVFAGFAVLGGYFDAPPPAGF